MAVLLMPCRQYRRGKNRLSGSTYFELFHPNDPPYSVGPVIRKQDFQIARPLPRALRAKKGIEYE